MSHDSENNVRTDWVGATIQERYHEEERQAMAKRFAYVSLGMLCFLLAPIRGEAEERPSSAGTGWGPRIGLADDPDQFLVGVHLDAGRVARNTRFRPGAELGLGDDHTIFALTAPILYRFVGPREITPYAGGGFAAGIVDHDRGGRFEDDDTDFEIALEIVGGLEWQLRSRNAFFLELTLVAGDLHDVKIAAGWILR
jgi:hypothetical protein